MRVPRFELEAYVRQQERRARFPLGSSGLAAFPLRDLAGAGRPAGEEGVAEEAFAQAVARARRTDAARVLPTVGASEALFLVPFALTSPGDRVLVERPAYPPRAAASPRRRCERRNAARATRSCSRLRRRRARTRASTSR
ncbi:MAG TPA: aminotransferase class I/II-fold pyridoxal phosphate-dependent enzyme [Candidatus Thermoplasmatota archaeon]|nr:aminotransferase class I/II-fold pyridoxal phosphate-dependent enzyme [Candidatus Thermoplasmatota archaeon]